MKVFNQENRLTVDNCAQVTRELQNDSIQDRQLYNFYYTNDCKCPVLDEFLFENNMTIKDGYGFTSGCSVDTDSDLRLNGKVTHDKARIQLCTRAELGVPNLNKGGFIPNIESRIRFGDDTSSIRSCGYKLAEVDFNRNVPLVGCLASTVQNPKYIIEDWTRGGDWTRNDILTNEYMDKCGFKQNGQNWARKTAI